LPAIKVDPDSGAQVFLKYVFAKSRQYTRLPDSCVANNQNLERPFVLNLEYALFI